MPFSSPFPPSTSKPGHGEIHLTHLPPSIPSFKTLSFTYPLKLIKSSPHTILRSPSSSPSPSTSPSTSDIVKAVAQHHDDSNDNTNTNTDSGSSSGSGNKDNKDKDEEKANANIIATQCPLLFLLTYGGGLLAGDHIHLTLTLDAGTRLCITTQGMGKIFRPRPSVSSSSTVPHTTSLAEPPSSSSANPPTLSTSTSSQTLHATLSPSSALWLAPDPSQPFAHSTYEQLQHFTIAEGGSLGLVDWVYEGRTARGERWDCKGWRGRNEIVTVTVAASVSAVASHGDGEGKEKTTVKEGIEGGRKRLLLRDSIILSQPGLRTRMEDIGIIGTVILRGPVFYSLGKFFVREFSALPRIGGRDWGSTPSPPSYSSSLADGTEGSGGHADVTAEEKEQNERHRQRQRDKERRKWRRARQEHETKDGVLWTACHVRGCTVVKFTGRSYQGARDWLGAMLREEGTVGREFGLGGLMFVR